MNHLHRNITFRNMVACAAVLAFSCAANAAGRVFYDDFESGGVSQWSRDGSRDMCRTVNESVDGQGPFSGRLQLECNWDGTVAWNDSRAYSTLKLNSWDYSREFLIRFQVRFASDVDKTDGGKLLRLYPGTSDSYYMSALMNRLGAPLFSYWESIGGVRGPVVYTVNGRLGDGSWHEVQIYVRHNTPGQRDGAVRVWVDKTVYQEAEGIKSVVDGGLWYPLYVMSNWSNNPGWEHDANNHVYWDNFEIYSDTGAGGQGSLAAGTIQVSNGLPPAPPPLEVR